ncbi:hypothetical protein TRFO_13421 [Tritrichomonas foetus]|uniref:Uncharacterized protein n=1 Tax=Tritrichomonas foetus TaxID=1144522 RepID=A0A1J4KXZ3_9EUKA|nr:hypothetical protein TRFO_13421 [Tritrichomonas foetus]|eukprot:OHT16103.1 hypothetical protein TRFO_13421 [Tritrichomonas foetus]
MGLFGGDPRYVYYQVLYKILVWYDVVMMPTLFVSLLNHFRRTDALVLPIPMFVFELLRVTLNSSHTRGDIPVYVAYLFVTFVTFALDIVNIIVVRNTGFFVITMCGYAIFHGIQLLFCVNVYRSFTYYQDGFYQFSRGSQEQNAQQINIADEIELDNID